MAKRFHHRPHFIYIAGCDGTGKTTQADLLLADLKVMEVKAKHLWLRFPFFFSLPFLAYARWRGHSWTEEGNGIRHGYWNFQPSWLLRSVFPWVLLLDAALWTMPKIYLPLLAGKTIVCERFVLDMLVDQALALGDPDFPQGLPGRLYPALLFDKATIVVLDLDAETIRQRRPDLQSDHRLEARLDSYRQLAGASQYPLLSSRKSREEINQCLWELIRQDDQA